MLRIEREHPAQVIGRALAEAVLHEHVCLGQDALDVARPGVAREINPEMPGIVDPPPRARGPDD